MEGSEPHELALVCFSIPIEADDALASLHQTHLTTPFSRPSIGYLHRVTAAARMMRLRVAGVRPTRAEGLHDLQICGRLLTCSTCWT